MLPNHLLMLTSAFKKLVGASTEFDTYTLLRLQAKSYRLIKNAVSETLHQYKLSVLDWSLLGILFQKPEGSRFVEISTTMGVEPPFVTELITTLKKKGFVKRTTIPNFQISPFGICSDLVRHYFYICIIMHISIIQYRY